MKNNGYRLVVEEFDANWKERTRELGSGGVTEQGRRLFDGYKHKLGERTIKLTLYDGEGNVLEEKDSGFISN